MITSYRSSKASKDLIPLQRFSLEAPLPTSWTWQCSVVLGRWRMDIFYLRAMREIIHDGTATDSVKASACCNRVCVGPMPFPIRSSTKSRSTSSIFSHTPSHKRRDTQPFTSPRVLSPQPAPMIPPPSPSSIMQQRQWPTKTATLSGLFRPG